MATLLPLHPPGTRIKPRASPRQDPALHLLVHRVAEVELFGPLEISTKSIRAHGGRVVGPVAEGGMQSGLASASGLGEDGNLDGRAFTAVGGAREESVVVFGGAIVVDEVEVRIKVGIFDGSCGDAQGEDQGSDKSMEEHRCLYLSFSFCFSQLWLILLLG